MAFSDELRNIMAGAKRDAPAPQPEPEAMRKEATRAAIWLARHGHDDRERHGERLAWYLACYRLGHGAADKGICLSGPCGTGKTVALRLLARWVGAHYMTATQAVESYRADAEGWPEIVTPRLPSMWDGVNVWPDLAIDDLGAEPTAASYGQRSEALATLVDMRETYYRQHGARLHIATNLVQAEIATRYGDRTLSRLLGLCHWREWAGADGRQATTAAKTGTDKGMTNETRHSGANAGEAR